MTTLVSIQQVDRDRLLVRRYDTKAPLRRLMHMGVFSLDTDPPVGDRDIREFWELPPLACAVSRDLPLLLEV